MKISKTHQEFADRLRNQRALDHPEEFLGPNWKDVLNFWFFLDTLSDVQLKSIRNAYNSLSSDECHLAALAANSAGDAAWAAWLAAADAACHAAADAACHAAGFATDELMGSHILQEQGKSLVFLPMFLNV